MNQKGFIKDVIIIIIGIVVLAGGYLYFAKKPAYAPAETFNQIETIGWKEFNDIDTFGRAFSIRYPVNWTVSGDKIRDASVFTFGGCKIVLGAGGRGIEGSTIISEEQIKVDGLSGVTKTYVWPDTKGEFAFTNLIKGNNVYDFELMNPSEDRRCLDDYKSIINTIKIK